MLSWETYLTGAVKRMLEDPSYSEIVRWGDDGDSFVVLEVMHEDLDQENKLLPLRASWLT